MYVPLDGKLSKGQPFLQFLHSSILPLTSSDPNLAFKPSPELKFRFLKSSYEPDIAIRIGRTPLSPNDPSTYADVSKYMEFNLRKLHSSTGGSTNSNLVDKAPVPIPQNLTGVQPNGKFEVLPFGCQVNPLASDSFKPVHLTPGCLYSHIDFIKTAAGQGISLGSTMQSLSFSPNGSGFRNNLFSSKKSKVSPSNSTSTTPLSTDLTTTPISISGRDLPQPGCSLLKNTSSIISKVNTVDNYTKKIANSSKFIVSTHGRIINVFSLSENPSQMNVEPPLVKITISKNVITSLDTFSYLNSNNEKVVDILVGLSNGEIIWINPFKMKFSRFNNCGFLTKSPVMTCKWLKNGKYFAVGLANGESMIIGRSFENLESYKTTMIKKKLKFGIIRHSLIDSAIEFGHYKVANKPITSINFHPIFDNLMVMTCDDGYLRLCDLLTERVIELHPSYYGGLLCSKFTEDGKYLLVGGCDDNVIIYKIDVAGGESKLKVIGRLIGSKAWIKSIEEIKMVKLSQNSYTITAVGDDGYLRIWEFPKDVEGPEPSIQSIKVDGALVSSHIIFKSNEYNILEFNGFGLISPQVGYRDVINIKPIFQFDINLGKVVFCKFHAKELWIGISTGDLMRWKVT